MASNLEDSSFDRATWTMKSPEDGDRWPPVLSLCFTVSASTVLWISIYEMVSLFR